MVDRVVTGAHYGLRDWLVQRVTALVIGSCAILFVGALLVCTPTTHEDWRALFAPQWMRLVSFVFFVSLFWHAWIGMRDIVMDYVKPVSVRLGLHVAIVLLLVAYMAWAAQILWSI